MVLGTIPTHGFAWPPLPILCATAVVILFSWIVATFSESSQLRKLQPNCIVRRILPARNIFEVSELIIYPIKSCRGISVRKTHMHMHGLYLDRQWMFVDGKTHKFVTMRENPKMTLINTQISEDGKTLHISVANEEKTISISTRPSLEWLQANTTLVQVRVWSDDTDGYMYGPEVNEPFSRLLERDVRLVYKGPKDRILGKNGKPEILGRVQTTHFADGFPLLIGSESSVTELNSRLTAKGEQAVTIERFRPNIIVRGSKPWAEDKWWVARVFHSPSAAPASSLDEKDSIAIDVVSRCTRCTIPNVEPNTAKAHKKEPSSTLSTYRRIDPGAPYLACFGMNAAPRNEGPIEVGMRFEVVEETKNHRIIKA